ncbi:hypothetical protein ARMGADRAFT_1080557 [Armillaria gallica]|uniref:Uncharacterized protein n=1 Tax=Armillaria gallica TaxID=47427 RepID=A0A2H3DTQ5_ARMGA|nr:hypothetical protein ARMGADRAFT_1080557 [Armillaria gallica]
MPFASVRTSVSSENVDKKGCISELVHLAQGTVICLPLPQLDFTTQLSERASIVPGCVGNQGPFHYAILSSVDPELLSVPDAPLQQAFRVSYFPIVSYTKGNLPDMTEIVLRGEYHDLPFDHESNVIPPPFATDTHPLAKAEFKPFTAEAAGTGNPSCKRGNLSWFIAKRVEGYYVPDTKIRTTKIFAPVRAMSTLFKLESAFSSSVMQPAIQPTVDYRLVFGGDLDESELANWELEDGDDSEWLDHFMHGSTEKCSVATIS